MEGKLELFTDAAGKTRWQTDICSLQRCTDRTGSWG